MTTIARPTPVLTYADLQETPDDGNRYELFDGELVVSASPAPKHQWVLGNLIDQLSPIARAQRCKWLTAPLDFVFGAGDTTTLQPDIAILTPEQTALGPASGPYREPPLLVIEILSPSNRVRDLRIKSVHYARNRVPYLWYIDPDWPSIVAYRLHQAEYAETGRSEDTGGTFAAPPFENQPLDLVRLWDWLQ
jgi:Uma2 family endonuclease